MIISSLYNWKNIGNILLINVKKNELVKALMLVLIALLDDIPVITIAYDRTGQVNNP
ncbi:MAG: hypothetical protein ACLPWD_11255 [Methanobacterium sp.]